MIYLNLEQQTEEAFKKLCASYQLTPEGVLQIFMMQSLERPALLETCLENAGKKVAKDYGACEYHDKTPDEILDEIDAD